MLMQAFLRKRFLNMPVAQIGTSEMTSTFGASVSIQFNNASKEHPKIYLFRCFVMT